MELKEIRAEILEHNDWLNGMVDYRDGDLMALANVDDTVPRLVETKSIKQVAELLKRYDNVSVKIKNIVFISHWNFGCFVYDIKNLKSYFEHYTISAFKNTEELADNIKEELKRRKAK